MNQGDIYVPLDGRYPDGAVRIEAVDAKLRIVEFVAVGGGWLRRDLKERFESQYRPATAEELRPGLRPGLFDIDGLFVPPVPGFTDRTRWNGWAKPFFEFDEARRVAEQWGGRYDAGRDAFVTPCEGQEDEEWGGVERHIPGRGPVRLYPVGAGCWTWDEEPAAG